VRVLGLEWEGSSLGGGAEEWPLFRQKRRHHSLFYYSSLYSAFFFSSLNLLHFFHRLGFPGPIKCLLLTAPHTNIITPNYPLSLPLSQRKKKRGRMLTKRKKLVPKNLRKRSFQNVFHVFLEKLFSISFLRRFIPKILF